MMGISLFGTCTMKYNPQINEAMAWRPELTELHPLQHEDTMQGALEIVHNMDVILREISGMDQFVFQAGGGAEAAFTSCAVIRAYHASRGELEQRNEIITTINTHPCNPSTADAAGFKVITLMLDENGYPSLDALKAAVSNRTAAIMVNNPDDMGVYNPEMKEWVRIVHEAGGSRILRCRQPQRNHVQDPRARNRFRCLHVHAAQDIWRTQERRRWSGDRRLRLLGGIGTVPSCAAGDARGGSLLP